MAKRQVKSPKVYVTDSGLLHVLLGLPSLDALRGHVKAGASFEGFCMQAVMAAVGARPHECFFWGVHAGAELDLLIVRGTRLVGFEFKLSSGPELTPSMVTAATTLGLERLWVVHGGKQRYRLQQDIEALPLREVPTAIERW